MKNTTLTHWRKYTKKLYSHLSFNQLSMGFMNVIERYILKIVAKHGQGNFYTE